MNAANQSQTQRACRLALACWGWPMDLTLPGQFRTWAIENMAYDPRVNRMTSRQPQAAFTELVDEHASLARLDWAQIHKSWWIHALENESPAIQRAVTAHAPKTIQKEIMTGLGLREEDLLTDFPAHPAILECVLSLWSVRLAAGSAPMANDAPVVLAIVRSNSAKLQRLFHWVGLIKFIQASEPLDTLSAIDRSDCRRIQETRLKSSTASPRHREQAKRDLERVRRHQSKLPEGLGPITFGRLLFRVHPDRVRWALQHLPMRLASMIFRETEFLSQRTGVDFDSLLTWEQSVFQTALQLWERDRNPFGIPTK